MNPSHYLYNERVSLVFNPKSHRYKVSVDGRAPEFCKSVTTVLSSISKGDGLIQWAVNESIEAAKLSLPESPLEYDQRDSCYQLDECKKAWKAKRTEAGNVGTQAHDWIETYIQGWVTEVLPNPVEHVKHVQEFSEPIGGDPRIQSCCEAALKWLGERKVVPLCTERFIYSIKHNYVGTLDMLALVDGRLSLVDWKSSNAIYDDYFLQTAAYAKAYMEETGERVKDRYIVRLGKVDGDFEVVPPKTSMKEDFKAFLAAKTLSERKKL